MTEFDWQDDGGVIYGRNGAAVRHGRRIHNMCGSSAYRLDWNGLSFVWTGDGRPDELTVEMSQGVDVFVTELELDAAADQRRQGGDTGADHQHDHRRRSYQPIRGGVHVQSCQTQNRHAHHTFYDRATLTEAQAGVRMFWVGCSPTVPPGFAPCSHPHCTPRRRQALAHWPEYYR